MGPPTAGDFAWIHQLAQPQTNALTNRILDLDRLPKPLSPEDQIEKQMLLHQLMAVYDQATGRGGQTT